MFPRQTELRQDQSATSFIVESWDRHFCTISLLCLKTEEVVEKGWKWIFIKFVCFSETLSLLSVLVEVELIPGDRVK